MCCLNAIAPKTPFLIGGSADLDPSNNTYMKGMGDFLKGSFSGRNIHYGVREHAMAGIMNGIALSRLLIPFGGTFLVFSDYMRPSIRLACLSNIHVIYVFTHDSIGLGEDGPTHQPIEHLAALRAIPNLVTIRPADANETREAWVEALTRNKGPTALVLTRQNLPVLERQAVENGSGVKRGAYTLWEGGGKLQLIFLATGSEVHVAIEAAKALTAEGRGVRVVSVPSWELFETQDVAYRSKVLPPSVPGRIVVEAARPQG